MMKGQYSSLILKVEEVYAVVEDTEEIEEVVGNEAE